MEEYEDAFFPKQFPAAIELPFYCAIADGATETSYSGLWANLLTEGFCKGHDYAALATQLPELRTQWNQQTRSKELPWYAEQKLEKGAYATLMGLHISEGEFPLHLNWSALAVGDSCLFHTRNHESFASFPATKAEDFTSSPLLLSSVLAEPPEEEAKLFQHKSGVLEDGDVIYLATDALAAWIFASLDRSEKPFDQLDQAIRTPNGFPNLIESLWDLKKIKNDDVTLLWIEARGERP